MRMLADKRFLILILLTPLFWWLLMKTPLILSEWKSVPQYADQKVSGVFTGDYLRNTSDMRWNSFGAEREDVLSQVFYNKGTVLANEFFNYTTYLSPRFYFQSGDQGGSSPPGIEPLAAPLFFFWFLGLLKLVNEKKFRLFLFIFLFSAVAYVTGRKTMTFLFPVAFAYLYIAWQGVLDVFDKKYLKAFYVLFVVYSLYLFGRLIWLV